MRAVGILDCSNRSSSNQHKPILPPAATAVLLLYHGMAWQGCRCRAYCCCCNTAGNFMQCTACIIGVRAKCQRVDTAIKRNQVPAKRSLWDDDTYLVKQLQAPAKDTPSNSRCCSMLRALLLRVRLRKQDRRLRSRPRVPRTRPDLCLRWAWWFSMQGTVPIPEVGSWSPQTCLE